MKQVPHLSLLHVRRMLGQYGLYQHATLEDPNLAEGYCVDDNARAVLVLLRSKALVQESDMAFAADALALCWKFIVDAQRKDGTMYNFRTSTGIWLTHDVSSDMYARVLRACVAVIAYDDDVPRIQQARDCMNTILRQSEKLCTFPRAWAEILIALRDLALYEPLSQDMQNVATWCTASLVQVWQLHSSKEWPWFEDSMTYANAILPHGLLASLTMHSDEEVERIVRASGLFLLSTTMRSKMFTPIGNSSWYHRNGVPSQYDQQPIEAGVMIDFLIELRAWDPDLLLEENILLPYEWFFGKNTAGLVMAHAERGTCYDGLHDGAVNKNCGAESLLAYLWAEVRMREVTSTRQ
jgi:hypothetical protein